MTIIKYSNNRRCYCADQFRNYSYFLFYDEVNHTKLGKHGPWLLKRISVQTILTYSSSTTVHRKLHEMGFKPAHVWAAEVWSSPSLDSWAVQIHSLEWWITHHHLPAWRMNLDLPGQLYLPESTVPAVQFGKKKIILFFFIVKAIPLSFTKTEKHASKLCLLFICDRLGLV